MLKLSCRLASSSNRGGQNVKGIAGMIKRALDIIVSGALLIICLPTLATCAVLVRLADGPPVLFGQIREGLNGSRFTMWKFRTMRLDAEDYLSEWLRDHPQRQQEWTEYRRLEHDPRVIPNV